MRRHFWRAALFFLVGVCPWFPAVMWADFVISDVMWSLIRDGSLHITEPWIRWVLLKGGLMGLSVMCAALILSLFLLERQRRAVPVWGLLLGTVGVAVIFSALFLPPDIIAQLYWLGCVVLATVIVLGLVPPDWGPRTGDSSEMP